MRYTQSKFSQDYKVDERYKGTSNRSQTIPVDNNTGLAFLKSFSKGLNFRPGSSRDDNFPPRVDNKELYNASNLMNKSENYFS
tara:strand:- start:300 stop:548 length:249 start_codon:yes stop_codon:yes gene_type:complete